MIYDCPMNKKNLFAKNATILILILIVPIVILKIINPYLKGIIFWKSYNELIKALFYSLLVLVYILTKKKVYILRFRRPRNYYFILFFLPFITLNLLSGTSSHSFNSFSYIILIKTFLIGFWEEFYFRELIQSEFEIFGKRLSILISSIIFCIGHFNNSITGVIIIFTFGLLASISKYYLGIWPLVFIHFIIDFLSDITIRKSYPIHFLILIGFLIFYVFVFILYFFKLDNIHSESKKKD